MCMSKENLGENVDMLALVDVLIPLTMHFSKS